jgi:hypothetical protein
MIARSTLRPMRPKPLIATLIVILASFGCRCFDAGLARLR